MSTKLRDRMVPQEATDSRGRTTDAAALIRAARELAPKIEAVRDDIERERKLSPSIVEAMGAAGLFSLWLPRALEGPELNVADYVKVIEELARIDGSIGWCATVASCYSRWAGYFTSEVARDIYGGGQTVLAGTLNPSGKAFAVEGGYRVTGRWAYGSGILHSTWTLGVCIVQDHDGPRRGPNGTPEVRLVLFPTNKAEVLDTWHVAGLRGTGSHDYRVADMFVPEDHAIPFPGAPPVLPGTLYAIPTITAFCVAIAAVPLGIARAAIDEVVELAAGKMPQASPMLLRDKPTVQADIGRAEALLGSARAFLFMAVGEIWDEVAAGTEPSLRRRALVRLACAQAAQASAQAVDLMYNAGGGTSLYETGRLERCFRDVHACTQHIAVSTNCYELCGRVLLGLDPGMTRF